MKKKTEKNIFYSEIAERSARVSVHMPVDLVTGNARHSGYIINISSRGIALFIDTKFAEGTICCEKGSLLKIELRSPLGELITMNCVIKWVKIRQNPPQNITTSIGMEVVDPPESFIKLFINLF